jgi:hypothetical protein
LEVDARHFKVAGPAELRTDSIVTSGKNRRRLVSPVAIKRDTPFQIADDLDVIQIVRIDANSTQVKQRGQYCGSRIEVSFAELESLEST